jgi:hypothetical protein
MAAGPPPGGYGGPPGGYGGPPGGYGPPPPPGGYGQPPAGYDPRYGQQAPAPPYDGYGAGPRPPGNMLAPFGVDPMTGLPFSDKSKVVAGLLQIFLGTFGVGRFYTGHVAIAVLQLLFGWLTCGIWPLVDGILMLAGKVKDAEGRPLRD